MASLIPAAVSRLMTEIARRFPGVPFDLDPPSTENGHYFLDIRRPGRSPIVVECEPDRGFVVGLIVADPDDPESDVACPDVAAALDQIGRFLGTSAGPGAESETNS